jgi:methionyl aminopeptidase
MKLSRNDACWCGSGIKYKKCHEAFDARMDMLRQKGCTVPDNSLIKTPKDIEGIKASAAINMAVLDYVAAHIKEGTTTAEIDEWVMSETKRLGGIPAPLNYKGFPKSVCTSINDVVCHGIPDENIVLKNGDIVNVDCSTILNGYFSDSSRMFCIGEVSEEKQRLVRIAKESLEVGLKAVKPWGFLGDMAEAINTFITNNGYSVVREIGGHGIGLEFHEEPWVGYVGAAGTGMVMAPGMVFTIEPMINMGEPDIYIDEEDDWTVYTDDGSPSAQWEIQILVTETGTEILCW